MQLLELFPVIARMLFGILLEPLFWLVVLIIFFQYQRMTEIKAEFFGIKESFWQTVVMAVFFGLLGGFFGSFLLFFFGISLSGIGIGYLWLLAVLLMLFNARFLCFAYAGGLLGLISLFFGYPNIEIPHLMGLVAILHLVESVLIWLSGHLDACPVYVKNRAGQVVGAFNLQKFWPIPLVVLAVMGSPETVPAQELVAMPDWWPLMKTTAGEDAVFFLLPVVAGLGYGELAVTMLPRQRTCRSAVHLFIYSVILLGLALFSAYYPILQGAAALFSPLGHEMIIHLGLRSELEGKPRYLHPRQGLKILEVVKNSPAARAGIKAGDIILEVNGVPVNSRRDFYDLLKETNLLRLELKDKPGVWLRRSSSEETGFIFVPEPTDRMFVQPATTGPLLKWWRRRRS